MLADCLLVLMVFYLKLMYSYWLFQCEEAQRYSRRSSRTGWPQHVWALELVHGKKIATERKALQQVAGWTPQDIEFIDE